MKKLNMLYLLSLLVLAMISCKDDDETPPTFKKADFIGEWQVTSTTVPDEDTDCDNPEHFIEFTEDEMTEGKYCENGGGLSISFEYTFDGKNKISYVIPGYYLLITQLNSTTMKLDVFEGSDKVGTHTLDKL